MRSGPDRATSTIAAIATAAGQGAIGIVRLSGPAALSLLRRLCPQQRFPPYRLRRADLTLPESGQQLDQTLACYMPGPRSYTGEDVVEVYGHGGQLNLQRLLEAFFVLGARAAQPGEFTRRAFVNGRLSLLQAESVSQIVAARSEASLRNAQAVLQGELGRKLAALRAPLLKLAAQLEAAIDFADELEALPDSAALLALGEQAAEQLQQLIASYQQGKRLDGASVVLAGPVNVGKSSLFNALLGRQRALVSSEPGTTRDYLEAEVSWQGRRIVLCDTVGERPAAELSALERAGQALLPPLLQQCDLVLAVVDLCAAEPLSSLPALAAWQRPLVLVANKADCLTADELQRFAQQAAAALAALPETPLVVTSAHSGAGLDQLRQTLLAALFAPAGEEEAEGVQVTSRRHYELLLRVAEQLQEGRAAIGAQIAPELAVEHCRSALASLDEITGERFSEAVLDQVFADFCLGK